MGDRLGNASRLNIVQWLVTPTMQSRHQLVLVPYVVGSLLGNLG